MHRGILVLDDLLGDLGCRPEPAARGFGEKTRVLAQGG